jgi:hypothetical protein
MEAKLINYGGERGIRASSYKPYLKIMGARIPTTGY